MSTNASTPGLTLAKVPAYSCIGNSCLGYSGLCVTGVWPVDTQPETGTGLCRAVQAQEGTVPVPEDCSPRWAADIPCR